jgi:hypothetical protein
MAREIDNDERTNALGLFNTARSYWRSAEHLAAARLNLTHPQAPVTFLFCHAIELYLKAYLRGVGPMSVEQLKQKGHHVASLAEAATNLGLIIGPEQSEILAHIANTDLAMEARYIVTGFKGSLPTNEALSNVAEFLDKAICSALAKAGCPVRAEQFTVPEPPQRHKDLSEATIRVLVHMFRVTDYERRSVVGMANELRLETNILQYHLDRLLEAKLADVVGSNYRTGNVYWDLTAEGRRFVVKRKPA